MPSTDDLLRTTLMQVAPGTALRDGLERILRGNTGALIVLGNDKVVDSICTGGFELDVDFSATRLRELSKMDGAIVVTGDLSKIIKAGVQLVPDSSIETAETGTRHRTAERVAKQTGSPVISVSQSMRIIALYVDGRRYVLDDSAAILSRANQALATLERYKLRLDEVAGTLSALEIEDLVTVRDVTAVIQRLEMVLPDRDRDRRLRRRARLRRTAAQPAARGADGRGRGRARAGRARLRRARQRPQGPQARDLPGRARRADRRRPARPGGRSRAAWATRAAPTSSRWRSARAASGCWPRCRGCPNQIVDRLIEHFGGLQKLLAASIDELQAVEGVGETRARSVREGLSRLAESSILERYV